MRKGRFIAIDGPNGVGKSTIVSQVCKALIAHSIPLLQTREPTASFNRDNEERHGSELAVLIVEDRRKHLLDEVGPALGEGKVVVTDRYIASSLVYRKLDGIPFETTWTENQSFLSPDLYVLLTATPGTLQVRVAEKVMMSRFEREHTSIEELQVYEEAHNFLEQQGEHVLIVDNEKPLDDVVAVIVRTISSLP